jgi:hypothetical protein
MKLSIIQNNFSSINSVYVCSNFVTDIDYLSLLRNKIIEYTEKGSENNYTTNVVAKMTNWRKLLEDDSFKKIHEDIIQVLYNIINLRNPNANENFNFHYRDSWGMKHEKGDYTKEHIHLHLFSGSFYFEVPTDTYMWFEDYQQQVKLESNMLVLFPGLAKHRVSSHIGDKPRYSMAFNIDVEKA